ncbi:MAG: Fe-S cluster assembly sulfur transfer protein SufU [Dehalococcoidia bacterium]
MVLDRDVELDELYREIILDHYRSPRNRGSLDQPTVSSEGDNPLCGDELRIELDIRDGRVFDVRFEGRGCSISQASASMMTEAIKGRSLEQVDRLFDLFKDMMYGAGEVDVEALGDLEALQGVRKFPVRVKCATLAWNTLKEALEKFGEGRA